MAQVLEDEGVDVSTARERRRAGGRGRRRPTPPSSSSSRSSSAPPRRSGSTTHTGGAATSSSSAPTSAPPSCSASPTPPSTDRAGRRAGRRLRRPDVRRAHRSRSTRALVYAGGDCFPGDLGAVVLRPRDGLLLFGADQAFTNDQVLRADNAAVALRLLGQDRRLVWYVPSLADLSAGEGVTPTSLLPRWIFPGSGSRPRARRPSSSGAAAAWAPSPPSRCPSSSAPSRPPAASGGCTVAPATARTRPRRCAGRRGRRAPSGCGSDPGSTRPAWCARSPAARAGPRPRSPSSSTHPPATRVRPPTET